MLHGLFTALVTPCDSQGNIDCEGLQQNIRFQIESGVDGVVLGGTTGEAPTITHDEKRELIVGAKEAVGRKVPLIVGTGTNSTKQTIKDTQMAEELQADAVLVIVPYYNKPSQEGIFLHFQEVARSTSLPIFLYNNRARCGTAMTLETVARLSRIDNIVGIKEVSSDIDAVNALIIHLDEASPSFPVFSGDDSTTFAFMAMGAKGVLSVAANIFPAEMKRLVSALEQGNMLEARMWQKKLFPLFQALGKDTNPIPVKAAMNMMNMPAGPTRPPLSPLSEDHYTHLLSVITDQQAVAIHG